MKTEHIINRLLGEDRRPNVDSKYGAPMGRRTYMPSDPEEAVKLTLERVNLVDGYDEGGAYWGSGTPLWGVYGEGSDDDSIEFYVRAKNYAAAQEEVRKELPNAIFDAGSVDGNAPKMPQSFLNSYVEAALWSSSNIDDRDSFLDEDYGINDIAPESLADMKEDCEKFWAAHWKALHKDTVQGGHDFWMTRVGHGSGFWDGDWKENNLDDVEDDGEVMTKAAKAFGNVDLYVGDDGKVYQSPG